MRPKKNVQNKHIHSFCLRQDNEAPLTQRGKFTNAQTHTCTCPLCCSMVLEEKGQLWMWKHTHTHTKVSTRHMKLSLSHTHSYTQCPRLNKHIDSECKLPVVLLRKETHKSFPLLLFSPLLLFLFSLTLICHSTHFGSVSVLYHNREISEGRGGWHAELNLNPGHCRGLSPHCTCFFLSADVHTVMVMVALWFNVCVFRCRHIFVLKTLNMCLSEMGHLSVDRESHLIFKGYSCVCHFIITQHVGQYMVCGLTLCVWT